MARRSRKRASCSSGRHAVTKGQQDEWGCPWPRSRLAKDPGRLSRLPPRCSDGAGPGGQAGRWEGARQGPSACGPWAARWFLCWLALPLSPVFFLLFWLLDWISRIDYSLSQIQLEKWAVCHQSNCFSRNVVTRDFAVVCRFWTATLDWIFQRPERNLRVVQLPLKKKLAVGLRLPHRLKIITKKKKPAWCTGWLVGHSFKAAIILSN